MKVVSGRRVQRAMACMAASSRPSASSTTASGLPVPGRGAKTSSCRKRRLVMGTPQAGGGATLPVHLSGDDLLHAAADPDLAFGIDLHVLLATAAELAPLAGQVALARTQASLRQQVRGDQRIGAAGHRVLGNAHARGEGTHHVLVADIR